MRISLDAVTDSPSIKDGQVSFSQFGEDVVIAHILETHRKLVKGGFFVDIGAHKPILYSNTYLLYKFFNWRGLNIEPNETLIEEFRSLRPEDISLACGVSDQVGQAEYTYFNHPGVNSIDKGHVKDHAAKAGFEVIDRRQIELVTLSSLLDEHLPVGREIGLLSVDVEGADLAVLRSNDWVKYRPFLVAVEDHKLVHDDPGRSETYSFLRDAGYAYCGTSFVTSFYYRTN